MTTLHRLADRPSDPLLSSILATASPPVSNKSAGAIVREHYGLDGTVERLPGERDAMFCVHAAGEADHLLKITNPAEPPIVTDLQTAALIWIERVDPTLPVQRVLPTREGKTELRLSIEGAEPRTVRLLSFLQGKPLHQAPPSAVQRGQLGAMLARLGAALRDFDHPMAAYELAWDIVHAERLRPLLDFIDDPARERLARDAMDAFSATLRQPLCGLRSQVVHNDLNLFNVLVSPQDASEITGIFDFGDIVRTQLANDVAIGAAYHIAAAADPLEGPSDFIAGYHAIEPLFPEEIELMPGLMATRLLATVLITGWRAEMHPDNRDYILKNNQRSWEGLERLASISSTTARDTLFRACKIG